MRNIVLLTALSSFISMAQEPAAEPKAKSAYKSVIGEVTALDASAKTISLKPDTGNPATVHLDEKTSYLKIPPGEKDLKKASRTTLGEVGVGDRVLARVRTGDESAPAVSVMVMSKAELAQHHDRNREEWIRRGVAGKVSTLDPATKQITLKVQSPTGLKDVVVEPADGVNFRRYAPDSVRFSDAVPSTFADVKVGDNMRVLGEKTEDGTRIKPEEVVSGTFRNLAATVLSVDAAAGEVKITNLETKKPLTVKINTDTSLKRLPPMMAQGLARLRQGGGAPGAGGPPAGIPAGADAVRARPGAGGPGGPGAGGPGGPGAGGPGGPGAGGPDGHGGHRGMDLQAMIERAPQFSLGELKPGDALVISSTAGSDPSRVTAITLVAGVEPLLTAPDGARQQPMSNVLSFDIAMPQ